MEFRLRVFEPWAPRGQVLPNFVSLEWSGKLCDHSVLKVQLERGSDSEILLDGEKEVALEVKRRGEWVEPPGCRFKAQSSSVNLVKPAATREFTFIGLSVVTVFALVWDKTEGDKDGKRVFGAQSPGAVLGTLMGEAKRRRVGGRDWAPGLAWTFTATYDSAGEPWGKRVSNSFVPTAPLYKVLDWLVDKGAVDWRMQGRELQVYRADGAMAKEVDAPMREAFASSIPVTVTTENLATTALMRGKDGRQWTRESSEAVSAFGRIEVGVDQGQVELDATAQLHMAAKLKGGTAPARQYRREWEYADDYAGPRLWEDYQIGDWVPIAGEQMRVVEAGIKVSDKGVVTGWETLGTRIASVVERLARKTNDLSDGMVGGENSPVQSKIGPEQETGTPAAPEALLVDSDAVANADGSHQSVVAMSWQEVTRTVEGRPVAVDHYQVEITENGAATYLLAATEPRLTHSGYPGARWRIRVRALSKQNVWGKWSETADHILAGDKIPPPKPALPVLSNELGTLRVTHSGLPATGGSMPPDLARWEVSVSESNTATPTPDATIADAGGLTWYKPGLEAGRTYYVRVRAVDRSENLGPWSDSASGTVGKVFDDEALRREIANGTVIGDRAIKTRHLAALSVGVDQLMANIIKGRHFSAGALDGFVVTGATVQTVHEAWSGVKLNRDGLFAYDSSGRETVKITGASGLISGITVKGSTISGGTVAGAIIQQYSGSRKVYDAQGGISKWISPATTDDYIEVNANYFNSSQRPAIILNGTCANYKIIRPGGIHFASTSEGLKTADQLMQGSIVVESPQADGDGRDTAIVGVGHHNTWTIGASAVYDAQWRTFIRGNGGVESYTGFRAGTLEIYAERRLDMRAEEYLMRNLRALSGNTYKLVQPQRGDQIFYEGSARRFKLDIQDTQVDPSRILDVPIRQWIDRTEHEGHQAYLADHAENGPHTGEHDMWAAPPGTAYGLIAEEVEDAGLEGFVLYDQDGRTQGISYDRLWTLLIPIVKEIDARLAALEGKQQ